MNKASQLAWSDPEVGKPGRGVKNQGYKDSTSPCFVGHAKK